MAAKTINADQRRDSVETKSFDIFKIALGSDCQINMLPIIDNKNVVTPTETNPEEMISRTSNLLFAVKARVR